MARIRVSVVCIVQKPQAVVEEPRFPVLVAPAPKPSLIARRMLGYAPNGNNCGSAFDWACQIPWGFGITTGLGLNTLPPSPPPANFPSPPPPRRAPAFSYD